MHRTHSEGLNYVPFLSHSSTTSTPPSSSRTNYGHSARRRSSTVSLPRIITTTTTTAASSTIAPASTTATLNALCYNGNYEGDASMFGTFSSISKSHLLDTDSETEFECLRDVMMHSKRFGTHSVYNNNNNSSNINSNMMLTSTTTTIGDSQLKRLCNYYISKCLPQQHLAKITAYAERLQRNIICRRLYDALCFFAMLLLWLMRLLVIHLVRLTNWTHQLWRGKLLLRNAARRLLWWMTLAKYKDVTYFVLILLLSPPLFAVALFGLMLAVYCVIKDCICQFGYFLRHRVF